MLGGIEPARKVVEKDHSVVRFCIPPQSRWDSFAGKTGGLGALLTDAVRGVAERNRRLEGVINNVDFNSTTAGHPIVDNERMAALVRALSEHRLGLRDVQPDILGRDYE